MQIGCFRFTFLPLPLGEITIRSGADSLRVEGLPSVTIPYTGGSQLQSTRLSILNATLRNTFAGGWFIGAGQTVYNQTTQYANPEQEVQYSRVTGLRLEAGRFFGTAANRIEAFGAVNGGMRGVQYTTVPVFFSCPGNGPCGPQTRTFADPENAAQVDLTARLAHRMSPHVDLLAGLRYVNYTARYDVAPGILADRNAGFGPSLGLRLRISTAPASRAFATRSARPCASSFALALRRCVRTVCGLRRVRAAICATVCPVAIAATISRSAAVSGPRTVRRSARQRAISTKRA